MESEQGTMSEEEPKMIWRLEWRLHRLNPKKGGALTYHADSPHAPGSMVSAAELLAQQMTKTVRDFVTMGMDLERCSKVADALDGTEDVLTLEPVKEGRVKLIRQLLVDGADAKQWTDGKILEVMRTLEGLPDKNNDNDRYAW